jgi:hypothetical protein
MLSVMDPVQGNSALLQALETKTKEAELLQVQIESARLEAQMLRLRLQIFGVMDDSLIPASLSTGNTIEDHTQNEHRRLLEWLSERIDVGSRRTCCVTGDLDIAGTIAVIGHGVQYTLKNTDGLNLTIPRDVEHVVLDVLSKARRGLLGTADDLTLAWDVLSVEMCSDGGMIPGLFLIRREDSAAIVISAWPKLPTPTHEMWRGRAFSAGRFFQEMSGAGEPEPTTIAFRSLDGTVNVLVFGQGQSVWHAEGLAPRQFKHLGISFSATGATLEEEQLCLNGPFGCLSIAEPASSFDQRQLVRDIVALCLDQGVHVHHFSHRDLKQDDVSEVSHLSQDRVLETGHLHKDTVSEASPMTSEDLLAGPRLPDFAISDVATGDNVEVHFEGQWFSGVLQGIDGEYAIVSCDVDDPDIITVAPLGKVRAASYDDDEEEHGIKNSVSQ